MKLLYLANKRLPTEKAYGIQITSVCKAFSDVRVEVELVAPTRRSKQGDDVLGYYGVSGFEFTRIWSPDFYWPGGMDRLAFWLKQWFSAFKLVFYAIRKGADVIYCREEEVAVLASLFGNKAVLEVHSFSSRRRIFYWLARILGVKVICITHALAGRMREMGFSSDHIFVSPDGVDLGSFEDLPSKSEARKRVHLPEDVPIVLYAGHLYPWKGADVLAEAAPKIDGIVVFVGGTKADAARFRAKYSSMPNVMLVGNRPHSEISMWLWAADVLVLPNRSEQDISRLYTSPLKMFEYMASGVPIVASDLPSIREVLNESSAVFSEPGSPDEFARAISLVLADSMSQERASRARRDVEQYSWLVRAHHIIDFISL